MGRLSSLGVGKAILTASLYHIPRAFLTLLAQIYKRDLSRVIYLSPMATPSVDWVFQTQRIAGEVDRMQEYQDKGVASFQQFAEYIKFWWK